jgi:hypothetical protein
MIYHDILTGININGSPARSSQVATRNEKFATVVDPDKIATIRAIANDEGRQLRALVDEAFGDLIEKRRQAKPRPHVMAAYHASVEQFDQLYKKLAE